MRGQRGSSWRRGPAGIKGEWLVLDRRRSKLYDLTEAARSLPYDLLAIRRPSDALAFIEHYGLLRSHGSDDEPRERYSDWEEEIQRLNGLLRLYQLLREVEQGGEDAPRRLREMLTRQRLRTLEGMPEWEGVPNDWTDERVATFAGQTLAISLDWGLGFAPTRVRSAGTLRVSRQIMGPPSEMVVVTEPSGLIGFVYYRLAVDMATRAPLGACLEPTCGRIFTIEDPRQRYCSSTCSNRTRQRRAAERRVAGTVEV